MGRREITGKTPTEEVFNQPAFVAVEGALKMAAAGRRAGRGWVDPFFASSEPPRRAKAKPEGAVATP